MALWSAGVVPGRVGGGVSCRGGESGARPARVWYRWRRVEKHEGVGEAGGRCGVLVERDVTGCVRVTRGFERWRRKRCDKSLTGL